LDTTTDLEVIRKNKNAFTWGYVLEIWDMGPYTIVKYRDQKNVAGTTPKLVAKSVKHQHQILYAPYFDGKRIPSSYACLEDAMIGAISHVQGYERTSNSAQHFISNMLQLDERPVEYETW
jgi:hypothetical protein